MQNSFTNHYTLCHKKVPKLNILDQCDLLRLKHNKQ